MRQMRLMFAGCALAFGNVAGKQDDDCMKPRTCQPANPLTGMVRPVSPSTSARATMPCRNSSGNVAREESLTPRAPRPAQVNATDTQRRSFSTERLPRERRQLYQEGPQARPAPAQDRGTIRNSYRPVIAGTRVRVICWISSNSIMSYDSRMLIASGRASSTWRL